jgi:hypothetical protein
MICHLAIGRHPKRKNGADAVGQGEVLRKVVALVVGGRATRSLADMMLAQKLGEGLQSVP